MLFIVKHIGIGQPQKLGEFSTYQEAYWCVYTAMIRRMNDLKIPHTYQSHWIVINDTKNIGKTKIRESIERYTFQSFDYFEISKIETETDLQAKEYQKRMAELAGRYLDFDEGVHDFFPDY